MDVEEATTEQFIGQGGTEEDNAPLLEDEIIFSTPASKVRKSTQILAALAATCGAFCLGTVLAWTSPVGKRLEEGELGFKISASELGWVGSLAGLGAAIVAPLAGQLVDRMGRRGSMLGLCVPLCAGWLLMAFAKNAAMLYAGRALTGASGGAFCVAIPVYISEIAHPPLRGALGSLFQLQLVMGVEMIYVAGPLLSIFWLSAICGFMSVFSFVALIAFAPESPSYLLRNGKPNAAHDALQWLWGPNFDLRPELNEMARQAASERSVSIGRVFTQRSTWIAIGLMAFQQFTGVNCIVFYVEEIFQDAGGSVQGANAAIIVGGVQLAACLVSTLVVDCAGRRPLLLVSGTVLAACCTTLGAYFFMKTHQQDVSGLGWLPVASVCVYFVVFSLGFGPVPWVMLGELFAPEVKGAATAVASAVSWWLTFLTTCQFQPLVAAIGEGPTFWAFAALTAIAVLFVAVCVPETKGRTLDQIQHDLNETSS